MANWGSSCTVRETCPPSGVYLTALERRLSRIWFSRSLSIQGTGLGMAITKNLLDLMGGKITVDSEKGRGSTFTVDLELHISEREGGWA